jgi:hypothetical protein
MNGKMITVARQLNIVSAKSPVSSPLRQNGRSKDRIQIAFQTISKKRGGDPIIDAHTVKIID